MLYACLYTWFVIQTCNLLYTVGILMYLRVYSCYCVVLLCAGLKLEVKSVRVPVERFGLRVVRWCPSQDTTEGSRRNQWSSMTWIPGGFAVDALPEAPPCHRRADEMLLLELQSVWMQSRSDPVSSPLSSCGWQSHLGTGPRNPLASQRGCGQADGTPSCDSTAGCGNALGRGVGNPYYVTHYECLCRNDHCIHWGLL